MSPFTVSLMLSPKLLNSCSSKPLYLIIEGKPIKGKLKMRSLMRAFKDVTENSLNFISKVLWSISQGTIPRIEDIFPTVQGTRPIPSEEHTLVSRLVSLPGMIVKVIEVITHWRSNTFRLANNPRVVGTDAIVCSLSIYFPFPHPPCTRSTFYWNQLKVSDATTFWWQIQEDWIRKTSLSLTNMAFSSLSAQALPVPKTKI